MAKQQRKALRKMGTVVMNAARKLVPQPGYPGDKPEFKPLRDTIGVEVKDGEQIYAVIGPERPAGAHGHLVEYGHRIVKHDGEDTGKMAEPHPFMEPAARDTRSQQDAIARQAIIEMDKTVKSRN